MNSNRYPTDDINIKSSDNLRPFLNSFRRRSTQTYQSILFEPFHQSLPVNNDLDIYTSKPENSQNTAVSTLQPQWKIYVLTTSITNYFCCGCNMRSSPENCFRWLGSHFQSPLAILKKRLGGEHGDEVGGIKLKLLFFLLDWTLDIGTSAYYFADERWIEATLTYLIVLGSGIITTAGFLRYPDIRSYVSTIAKKIGLVWYTLLYIPTFLPFVYGRMWLDATIEFELAFLTDDEPSKIKLIEERDKIKDLSLKAFWLEIVLESKPQALLQSLFLLERTQGFNSILDFLPVILSVWSMTSMTNSIYELISSNFKDETEMYSKLYGNTYTALSILAPVMIVNIFRDQFTSNLNIFLATLSTLVLYYLVFEVIYQLSYMVSNLVKIYLKSQSLSESNEAKDESRHILFARLYQVVLLLLFCGCVILWDHFSSIAESDQMKRMIIIIMFSLFLIVNIITFIKAEAFAVESFRLKNVKIDNFWEGIRKSFRDCFNQPEV